MSSASLAVVIPTIRGREDVLAKALTSFGNAPVTHTFTIHDKETCGEAWNEGISLSLYADRVSHVLLFADDLYPANPDWFQAGAIRLMSGEIPAPILLEESGARWNPDDGQPGEQYAFPRVPLLTLAMARDIFPIPKLHYYSDCWVGTKADYLGIKCRVTEGFAFYHSWSEVGRIRDTEPDRMLYETEAGRIGR